MKNETVWGADPGKDGALALLDASSMIPKILELYKFPLTKNVYDPRKMKAILEAHPGASAFFLEDVHALFNSAAKATFQFGGTFFALQTAAVFAGIPLLLVQPKAWQAVSWANVQKVMVPTDRKNKSGEVVYKVDTKATSLMAAGGLWPSSDFKRTPACKGPDAGFVDAALIGYYGVKSLRG
jgi:hypothetical protein